MHTLHHYDGHRTICSCSDKAKAARLSGHSWNILSNRDDGEILFRHARSSMHCIDDQGRFTKAFFHRRGRVQRPDGGGVISNTFSEQMSKLLVGPPSSGREEAALRAKQVKHLCQMTTPRDFQAYLSQTRLYQDETAPRTPVKPSPETRVMEFPKRPRTPRQRPTPRLMDTGPWSARRGEKLPELPVPSEQEMIRTVDQLRTRPSTHTGAMGHTLLSARADSQPHHSSRRAEALNVREISAWHQTARPEILQREDMFYGRPHLNPVNSCVKYNIVTNERRQFWY